MSPMRHARRPRIRVVAAGQVSAVGAGVAALHAALEAGASGIRPIGRFPTDRLRCRTGGLVDFAVVRAGLAAARLAGPAVDPDENPKLAFALLAAAEALAPLPDAARAGTAVWLGAGLEEIRTDRIAARPAPDRPICPEIPPALLPEFLAERLALARPARALVSACAAGAQAVGEAFRALSEGACELALAGGVDSMLNPFGLHAFDSLGALATGDELLRPFDRRRTGTLLGEGAALLLLATDRACGRYGLRPVADLLGYGASLDARHPVMPDPEGGGARLAMKRALDDAGLEPADIACINAHGSGTAHNDRVEARAIRALFGDGPDAPFVSASKPHFGHLLAAGGAIECLCLLYAVTRDRLPPTLNLDEVDPDCALNHVFPAARSAPAPRGLTNSFGLNGQNASLVFGKVDRS